MIENKHVVDLFTKFANKCVNKYVCNFVNKSLLTFFGRLPTCLSTGEKLINPFLFNQFK